MFTIKIWAMEKRKTKNNAIENQIHWNLNDHIAAVIYNSYVYVCLCIRINVIAFFLFFFLFKVY